MCPARELSVHELDHSEPSTAHRLIWIVVLGVAGWALTDLAFGGGRYFDVGWWLIGMPAMLFSSFGHAGRARLVLAAAFALWLLTLRPAAALFAEDDKEDC